MKVYCPTCGSGTAYTMSKPKFCSSCGEAFSALNKIPAKRVFRADPRNNAATIQEEVQEEEVQTADHCDSHLRFRKHCPDCLRVVALI